jgi:hypothetical protein
MHSANVCHAAKRLPIQRDGNDRVLLAYGWSLNTSALEIRFVHLLNCSSALRATPHSASAS